METVSIACCVICFDSLCQSNLNPAALSTSPSSICSLECGHVFHRNCVARWFNVVSERSSKKCPLCQTNFTAPPKIKTIYVSFQTSFAFDDLKKSYTKSELENCNLKKEKTEAEVECRNLRAQLRTIELERLRQPFGSIGNLLAAPAHNEVQKTPLDLRISTQPAAEAPERQPIRRVHMLQRSATSLNPNSRPPSGSYLNNPTETALSPRSRLASRSRLHNREYRPPIDD